MCYLLAKKFDDTGCVAVKTKHGKELVNTVTDLENLVKGQGIQIVTISRPTAYGEYEPYTFCNTMADFHDAVENMAR